MWEELFFIFKYQPFGEKRRESRLGVEDGECQGKKEEEIDANINKS